MTEDDEVPREFFEAGLLVGPKNPGAYAKWRAERDKAIATPKRNEAALELAKRTPTAAPAKRTKKRNANRGSRA